MASYSLISPESKAYARLLRERENLSVRQVAKLTGISKSSVSRICSKRLLWGEALPSTHGEGPVRKRGRPPKLSVRQKRAILKELRKTRSEGQFSVRTLRTKCELHTVSERTISRFLNKSGYKYYQARKKGLLFPKDLHQRWKFARGIKRSRGEAFWTKDISFYFDATAFNYKSHPRQHANTLSGRVWRKKSEGLSFGCTAKGSKVGSGGKVVRVYAAISYGNGVVLAKPYRKLTGKRFSKFMKKEFPAVFQKCEATHNTPRIFLQDGDPSQNSKKAIKTLSRMDATIFKIPPRSPDLNPIENIFKLLGDKLKYDAIENNIEFETFRAFRSRVVTTLLQMPRAIIDKTIASMGKRIDEIIRRKGERLKY